MEIKLHNESKIWYYRVKKADESFTLERFLKRFNFPTKNFESLNPDCEKLIAGKILFMPPSSKYYHIVGPLENYENLARSFNYQVEDLKKLNRTNFLFIGQRIFL